MNPSFEYPSEKYRVFIRYSLNAKVKSDIYTGETSLYVEIKGIPNNNKNSKVEATSLPIKRGSIFDIGNIILNASCDSKIFRFTSPIPVNINIDNTKSKVKATECKIDLIRKITLRDQRTLSDKYTKENKLIKKKFKSLVEKNEKKNFQFELPLNTLYLTNLTYYGYKQPYNNSSKSNIDLIPSVDGTIIKCEYYLKVTLYFDSFVSKDKRPRIILPIYFVHKLDINNIFNEKENEYEDEDEDIRKAIELSKNFQENNKKSHWKILQSNFS